jgi:hypothetical protein
VAIARYGVEPEANSEGTEPVRQRAIEPLSSLVVLMAFAACGAAPATAGTITHVPEPPAPSVRAPSERDFPWNKPNTVITQPGEDNGASPETDANGGVTDRESEVPPERESEEGGSGGSGGGDPASDNPPGQTIERPSGVGSGGGSEPSVRPHRGHFPIWFAVVLAVGILGLVGVSQTRRSE